MATRSILALMGLLVLAGCAGKTRTVVETIEFKVPVPVRAEAPAELMSPWEPVLPTFVSPTNPRATVALDEENGRLLRSLIRSQKVRDDAWRAWALEPLPSSIE